VKNNTSAKIRI